MEGSCGFASVQTLELISIAASLNARDQHEKKRVGLQRTMNHLPHSWLRCACPCDLSCLWCAPASWLKVNSPPSCAPRAQAAFIARSAPHFHETNEDWSPRLWVCTFTGYLQSSATCCFRILGRWKCELSNEIHCLIIWTHRPCGIIEAFHLFFRDIPVTGVFGFTRTSCILFTVCWLAVAISDKENIIYIQILSDTVKRHKIAD